MMHYELVIKSTTEQVERSYAYACNAVDSTSTQRTFYDHAFGAVQLASVLVPIEELDAITNLWIEYRAKFEALIYGE